MVCLNEVAGQVRAETAEFLFSLLQTRDIIEDSDDLEAILLETEWYVDP